MFRRSLGEVLVGEGLKNRGQHDRGESASADYCSGERDHLIIGTTLRDDTKNISLAKRNVLHHTLVVGQSGSGKSFFVARLLEEILLRTRARVVIVDPNGDFRRLDEPSQLIWSEHKDRFSRLEKNYRETSLLPLDNKERFTEAWNTRRFLYLKVGEPAKVPDRTTRRVCTARLFLHWGALEDERRFLLAADAREQPKVFLGLDACSKYLNYLHVDGKMPGKAGLVELAGVADQFLNRDLNLRHYPQVKELSSQDWDAVRAQIHSLLKEYSIWWKKPMAGWFAPHQRSVPLDETRIDDLNDYIDRCFSHHDPDCLTLGLERADSPDVLLAVNVTLWRLWKNAKTALAQSESEKRVPTFIVIDEAHNFVPAQPVSPLQGRVTERILQIASEGRKYGLYLILATQRPTKLHPGLVPECENSALLRVQSTVEQDFAASNLGIAKDLVATVGQAQAGQALMVGRWVEGVTTEAKSALARTVVGGGGLPEAWQSQPSFDITSEDPELMSRLARLLMDQSTRNGGSVTADEVRVIFDGFSKASGTTDEELRGLVEHVTKDEENLELAEGDPWRVVSGVVSGLSVLQLYLENRVLTARVPLRLADLAHEVYRRFGASVKESSWFGKGTFRSVIEGILNEQIVASWDPPGYVYDSRRLNLPDEQGGGLGREESARSRLAEETGVPLLTSAQYAALYREIAAEVNENGYVLTRVTRVVRDKLAEAGEQIPRSAVSFVTTGIWSDGHHFDGEVAEIPQTLAHHFYRSAIDLAGRAEVGLSDEETDEIRDWLLAGDSLEERRDDVATSEPRSGSQDELGPAVERGGTELLEGDKMDR